MTIRIIASTWAVNTAGVYPLFGAQELKNLPVGRFLLTLWRNARLTLPNRLLLVNDEAENNVEKAKQAAAHIGLVPTITYHCLVQYPKPGVLSMVNFEIRRVGQN